MIIDQGIGANDAQSQAYGLGWVWTWVSGDSQAPVVVDGPFFIKASQAFTAGSKSAQDYTAGSKASQSA